MTASVDGQGDRHINPLSTDLDHVLAQTGGLWDDLRDRQLFVTGGTGFVGRWLLESLLWANRRLRLGLHATVLTRDPQRFGRTSPHLSNDPAIELLAGNMSSFTFPTSRIDFVIHAATETVGLPGTYDPVYKFEADVEGTRRVVALAKERGARRLIFTSSGAVYGPQPTEMTHIPESYPGAPDPTDPATAYGQAKRASEFVCTAAAATGGPGAVIARCFAFTGAHLPLDSNYAIGNFIRDALAGGPIVVSGDGTPLRSYLYSADLAIWLWSLLLRGQPSRVYNVGSDVSVSIAELATVVARTVSPGCEVKVLGRAAPGEPVRRYVPSIDRARTELGLKPLVSLPDAIQRTAAWHRNRLQENT